MEATLVRYTVKADRLEENRALVRDVFAALARTKPDDVHYLALELEGGEFVHLVVRNGTSETSALTQLPAFVAFNKDHGARRAGPLNRQEAKIVGQFALL